MTYCAERTRLLARAGQTLAKELLPKPFMLWHSDHSTGIQMTIVAPGPDRSTLPVWKGSVWHSSIYEFNDSGTIAGLQPDFAFAKDVIEKYFEDVRAAVEKRQQARAAAEAERTAKAEAEKRRAIDEVRTAITQAAH